MRYSGFKVLKEALTGHKGWTPAWRDPEPKARYDIVVVGGSLTGQHLLTGVRESVYSYSPPLATNDLRVVEGRGDARSGATGAALLAVARTLQPDEVNGRLRFLAEPA